MQEVEGIFYTQNHEWIVVEGNTGVIGVTDYAQREMGDVVFVELPKIGDDYAEGDCPGVVESVKAVSDVYMPVGGEVLEVNEILFDNPELINEDPFGEGWLIKVKIKNEDELKPLMNQSEYDSFLEEVE